MTNDLLKFSFFYISLIVASILSFYFTRFTGFIFVPFAAALLGVALLSPMQSFAIILCYISFDGMLKILSNYNPIIHVSADLVIVFATFRWILQAIARSNAKRFKFAPFVGIFIVHTVWVTIEILNPYGLGLIPGIAAYKVYLTFLVLYFLAYNFIDNIEDFRKLLLVAVLLICVQSVLSVYQFSIGPNSVLSLSENYRRAIIYGFMSYKFRPFGMGSSPGAPSVWIFLSAPLLLCLFEVQKKHLMKILYLGVFLLCLYVLVICQVRASIIKAFFGVAVTFLIINWRRPFKIIAGLATFGIIYASLRLFLFAKDPRMAMVQARIETLYDLAQLRQSRRMDVFEEIIKIWGETPFGIGLSRVGAASGPFKSLIEKNEFFGLDWTFADNLYRAIAIELGIPGTIFYLSVVFLPLFLLLRRVFSGKIPSTHLPYVAAVIGLCCSSILGYFGSEGALYLPECAYFWLFLGAAVRLSEPTSSPTGTGQN